MIARLFLLGEGYYSLSVCCTIMFKGVFPFSFFSYFHIFIFLYSFILIRKVRGEGKDLQEELDLV